MSEKEYSPAIVQINFDFTSFEKTQNLESIEAGEIELQSDVELINPLVVAQYALYNRELEDENFGLDDNDYLGYPGGLITVGDKVNTKRNPFSILGNFSVYNKAEFRKDIYIKDPRTNINHSIRNIFQYENAFVGVYGDNNSDNEAMSVGDFRRNTHHKGMIMMWSGTFQELENNLPYWRLCAPPDSGPTGTIVNNVKIPNLIDTFIISSNYRNADNSSFDTYQPRDNDPDAGGRNFGNSIRLNLESTGGVNSISLTENQMPSHRHDVNFEISNFGGFSVQGSDPANPLNPAVGNGFLKNIGSVTAKSRCIKEPGCSGSSSCPNKRGSCPAPGCTRTSNTCSGGATYYTGGISVRAHQLGNAAFTTGTLSLFDPEIVVTQLEQDLRGSGTVHENRPDFYVLAYIVYVGVKRN